MLSLPGARARFEFRPISIRTRKRFLRCWYIRACKSGFRGERSSAGREKAYKKDRSMDELSQYPYTFLHPLFHWWFEKMLPCSPVSKSRKGYIIHGYWIAYMREDPTKEREREEGSKHHEHHGEKWLFANSSFLYSPRFQCVFIRDGS